MSMINKIKEITNDIENLSREKTVVKIVSDCDVVIENYNSIKVFDYENLILQAEDFFICIKGQDIVVEYFSPSRIIARGKILEISYRDSLISEEL